MNTKPGQELQQCAANLAIKKLTRFAVCESTSTQKRALSFLKPKPAMTQLNKESMSNLSSSHLSLLKQAQAKIDTTKKPADFLHQLTLSNLRKDAHKAHLTMFWGNGANGNDWEKWLREKGLLGGSSGESESKERQANGWTDPNDDLSDFDEEDDAWIAGGMKRPGEHDSEEFSSEEAMDDEWDDSDDDDDHGGHMMPIPSI
mmetsp:Transcript_10804/g.13566  ORF Transcript_10804/g.13566 Transcript_10804/m.13566 type:complete len:202 (-) Transcript_10804:347-952(-)|eukprot:CAMPEP_0170467948 /NCGR_PEP_ID=MMETSP0123-20130129/11327_1 /TAXON_ID=182087 /ORGANISM="Favella ehrenbergii, Strain Fehren 1" /LENGTH=201 /DNA_ID=CAMNT_0010734425 /DNA_START=95 /DNA_END=700 /DNA_ORIENTATION=+